MKGKKRKRTLEMKKTTKTSKMGHPGYKSCYAKKHKFLAQNGGWGFEYPDKPWK